MTTQYIPHLPPLPPLGPFPAEPFVFPRLPAGGEIIIDSFAGGGGASEGIFHALGRHPDAAINHDPEAVALHAANHPSTVHYCQSVYSIDPRDIAAGRPVGLLWASPDCKHFSKAKGGQPLSKNIRDLAWVVVTYAERVSPRVIILENVEEYRSWCDLVPKLDADGKPVLKDGAPVMVPDRTQIDPDGNGATFKRWVAKLRRLGYSVQWRELRACDYGAPTIRKRLYLIARCDGRPIVWPEPTHGAPNSPEVLAGKRQPWRTAAEIIDWSLPCPSIFLTKEEARAIGVKRPLEETTLRRIFNGLKRYVLENPRPFIVPVTHAGNRPAHDSAEPLRTVTTAKRGELSLVMPHLTRFHTKSVGGDVGDPLATVETHLTDGLVAPFLTKFRNGSVGSGMGEPVHTVTCSHSSYHPGGSAPIGVVMPYIQTYYGAKSQHEVRGAVADGPLGTQTTENRHAVVSAWMAQHNNDAKRVGGVNPGREMEAPVSTVTASGSQQGVAAVYLSTMRNSDKPFAGADEPAHTVTAGGAGLTLQAAFLSQFHGTNQGNAGGMDRPLGAVLSQGFHHAEVRAFLVKYFGAAEAGQEVSDPLHTVTAKPRFGLVRVAGVDHEIVDIGCRQGGGDVYEIADLGLRMLSPRELYRAQGFPDSYKIDIEYKGRRLPKSSQVRMCGNSVSPVMACALARANVPDLAVERLAAE